MRPDAARDDVAVIGMAGRFPGADSTGQLWSLIEAGAEGIVTLADPPPQGEAARHPPGSYVPRRGIVADVDCFDAELFRMTAAEAALLDPQQRLMLEVGWHALEDAGIADGCGGALGIFVSTGISQYLLQNLLADTEVMAQHGALQLLLHNDKDTLATRMSYLFDAHGPSVTVQTGCSSSLVAVHLACRSLLEHECDAALAGGVSLALPQQLGYFYSEQMIHSRDGRCRAFDAEASGTVRGNGACAVVLKRLSDAVAARDPVWAVIKGSAVNNDGRDKVGFTAPSLKGQAAVIAAALRRAGVAPESIELIEAHGTGTPLGDPIEAQALKAAFRDVAFPPGHRCAIGALKSSIGHLDAAAGAAGLIKVCLALTHQKIPPVVHFRKLNPRINLAGTPFVINAEPLPWPRRAVPRRAGVSAFGIGGTNVHVVVEEAPQPAAAAPQPGPFLLAVSAATPSAFAALCERYRGHLDALDPAELAGFACATLIGRKALAWRAAAVVTTAEAAIAWLQHPPPPRAAPQPLRKLSIGGDDGAAAAATFAQRLAALGVDAAIVPRGDLHLESGGGGLRLSGKDGEALWLPQIDPPAGELTLLAALWLRGVRIDWRSRFGAVPRLRIPGYPFARQRHWIEPQRSASREPPPTLSPPVGDTALRQAILAEWRGLIGRPDLDAADNVFEAGATSLMVGQFVANLRAHHGLVIGAIDPYREPSPAGLAAALAARFTGAGAAHAAPVASRDDEVAAETFMDL